MKLILYLQLIRARQWYKNLVIFLPILFVGELLMWNALEKVILGFLALCLISSANYVLNDIIDRNKDRLHAEKKYRPIASKQVSIAEGLIIIIILLALGLLLASSLGRNFLYSGIFLFLFTLLYSTVLKKEPIADVIAISINFVVRAVAGAFIIQVIISPWLILCPFFLALFLAVGKRDADLKYIKLTKNIKLTEQNKKNVSKQYNFELTNALMIISTTCLIISYSLYTISRNSWLLLSLPFAIFSIFRYYYLVNSGDGIARNPENFYKDKTLIISILLWALIIFLIFYAKIGLII